jgi:transposase
MRAGSEIVKLLCSIPGIGDLSSVWMAAEIGDIRRFPTDKALAAWAGVDLSLRESAGQITSYSRRKGTKHVHWLLVQAAQACLRGKSELGLWAKARITRGGKGAKQRAVGMAARKIAKGVYQVLTRGEKYEPTEHMRRVANGAETKPAGGTGTSDGGDPSDEKD